MRHQSGFQKLPLQMWFNFWIPLREKKTQVWHLVLSLASAASVGHSHRSLWDACQWVCCSKDLGPDWVGKSLWEGSDNECAKKREICLQLISRLVSGNIIYIWSEECVSPTIRENEVMDKNNLGGSKRWVCSYCRPVAPPTLCGTSGGLLVCTSFVPVEKVPSYIWGIMERAWIILITTINGFLSNGNIVCQTCSHV